MPKPNLTEQWEQRLSDVDIRKTELNRLVMHYLLTEGYKDAAEEFARESGIKPAVEMEGIQERLQIRQAVQRGDIEDAIERINDLDPELLDAQPDLYFKLQQQRLIEYLREGKLPEALAFAQEELAQRGEENPALLEELERTMALFAFADASTSPLARLMDDAQRQRTASQLNTAILAAQSLPQNPKLSMLLRTLFWSQQQLDGKATYPHMTSVVDASLSGVAASANSAAASQHMDASTE
ncbi:CTLH/CRA C-terminal to lish motif domain-containing protein [Thamnocephalis sphaerospora]|uniref:CTLH/CRA C-terminal to lish motif domain-containing protein n=1 Tax=Thamnocephalis sphaerospora TaxID=78915 RepID=A0A4P9XRW4_9FUNG|nr:CTLH/CRA C-terminal to lish motif domain-containing protein [Thamnocephalis sphaerospora]|eukprot:RKP08702.1 CTLH/CRA C-terminal to lish motif domain-containing protein [Thamnocephalis sphaerospora]